MRAPEPAPQKWLLPQLWFIKTPGRYRSLHGERVWHRRQGGRHEEEERERKLEKLTIIVTKRYDKEEYAKIMYTTIEILYHLL